MDRIEELNALDEAEAEELSGTSILALQGDKPKARLYAALAFIHKRKSNPEIGTFMAYAKSARTVENITYLYTDPADEDEDDEASEDGEPTPFPEDDGGDQEEAAPGPDDAEGAVLSGDGDAA